MRGRTWASASTALLDRMWPSSLSQGVRDEAPNEAYECGERSEGGLKEPKRALQQLALRAIELVIDVDAQEIQPRNSCGRPIGGAALGNECARCANERRGPQKEQRALHNGAGFHAV